MGLFDFFKRKKKDSDIQRVFSEMYKKMFPHGSEDEKKWVADLVKLFDYRYSKEEIQGMLRYVLSLVIISPDKSQDRVVGAIMRRPKNVLLQEDAIRLYKYAMTHHPDLNLMYMLMTQDYPDGATTDVIPNAYGEYGRCLTNPIPVKGIPANEVYLRKLRHNSGMSISWIREGSGEAPNISNPIDIYKLTLQDGTDLGKIYISPYQNVISKKTPEGFYLADS